MPQKNETFIVEGMSCNHCKLAVETAVKKLTGVASAEVELAAKTLQVEYDNGQVDLRQIGQAVEDAGFEVV